MMLAQLKEFQEQLNNIEYDARNIDSNLDQDISVPDEVLNAFGQWYSEFVVVVNSFDDYVVQQLQQRQGDSI